MADSADNSPTMRQRLIGVMQGMPVSLKRLVPRSIKARTIETIAGDDLSTIALDDQGTTFTYRTGDSYWGGRKARDIRQYEPELWYVADHFITPQTVFVDCGANAGLWSSYAAGKIKNPDQVIAVEPGDSILPLLRTNHEANQGSFTIVDKAIWSRSGEELEFLVQPKHCSSSLAATALDDDGEPLRRIQVATACVDDLVESALARSPSADNVIIKLDVEGGETEALKGARRTLEKQNTMIIYEDHGKDPTSKATEFFLQEGLHVYNLDAQQYGVDAQAISNTQQLVDIKLIPTRGYNFVACKPGSGFDLQMQELCEQTRESKRHRERLEPEATSPEQTPPPMQL